MTDKRLTLKALRSMCGNLTQGEAAEKIGVTQSQYNAFERVLDNEELLERIGDTFGVKIEVTIT